MNRRISLFLALIVALLPLGTAGAIPNMSEYSSDPVFITQSVPPNIMIILDNSGSMNFNAYGSWPGSGNTVNDEPYEGAPYNRARTYTIVANADDMEERYTDGGVYDSSDDLDFGEFVAAMRFQNVDIPQGATISYASIGFIAKENCTGTSNLIIDAELSEDAPPISPTTNDITGRTGTTTVPWNPIDWDGGDPYSTDDLSTIVSELVNQPGWQPGNAMLFRVYGSGMTTTGIRRAWNRNRGITTAPVLRITVDDPGDNRYYGYFSPDYFYKYNSSSNVFEYAYKKVKYNEASGSWDVETLGGGSATLTNSQIATGSSSTGLWDGNWLNWLCMRRIDVLRKVLFGGDTQNGRDGSGHQILYGEGDDNRYWYKNFDDAISAVSPYTGNLSYRVRNEYITVGGRYFTIRVEKDIAREPADFHNYDNGDNLAGVVQRIWDMAQWGNIWFRSGTGWGNNGGFLDNAIGADQVDFVRDLEARNPDTWTPLAETFYTAMQYFRQELPQSGYNALLDNVKGDANDPFYRNGGTVPCAKSYVILLTDGASTMDSEIPGEFKDYDGDGDRTGCVENSVNNCDYPSYGTDFLDDVALYAHTNDLRPEAAMGDMQTITLYTIYAFGNDPNARQLLQDAAKNGGFKDLHDNYKIDETREWDEDGDGIPDTYYEASDGYSLEAELLAAFGDIGKEAASGTSASVLATNSEGEGHVVQAYFRSAVPSEDDLEEVRWVGYLQSLWVDNEGNLREDTAPYAQLDDSDPKVVFGVGEYGNTYFQREGSEEKFNLDQLEPIFESAELLMQRDLLTYPRKIFTFLDDDQDGLADEATIDMLDTAGEVVTFDTSIAGRIKPYLGVYDNATYGTGGLELGAIHDERVENIITWVRGTDVPGLRNRTIDGQTWRLGDIINSTPVTVAQPIEDYHIAYSDGTYREYWQNFKERETMIYVGSNDGMLHAFTSWNYDKENTRYVRPTGAPANERIGDEVWAFIPQAVLPHLKWPAHANYTHTYLVDGRPRVFDAKILPAGTHYTNSDGGDSWGTFLVMGLNMGALEIDTTEDWDGDPATLENRNFYPTYFCIDITEPRNPRLMWEQTYPDLASSRTRPAPLKVGDNWYLVFGSGPTDYDGTSDQPAYLYIADLKTGQMLQRFGPEGTNAFFNDPATFDKGYNYNVDTIYATYSNQTGSLWNGGLYKVAIPCSNCEWEEDYDPASDFGYDENPANWYFNQIFDIDRPITAAVGISTEYVPELSLDNVWVYFGTGRYITNDDVLDADQQYLFGVKDPFFNANSGVEHDYVNTKLMILDNLFAADEITVTEMGHVLRGGSIAYGDFWAMEEEVQKNFDGWYRRLETNGTDASERIVSKPTILGGMVLVPAFTPDSNICSFGGITNLYGLYYATGTGYIKQIFNVDTPDTVTVDGNPENVIEVKMPGSLVGTPPPGAGMHAGQEVGAKAFLQQSSGQMAVVEVVPPFYFQSALIDWWE